MRDWPGSISHQVLPYSLLSRWWPYLEKISVLVKVLRTIDYNVWTKFEVWNCDAVYEVSPCTGGIYYMRPYAIKTALSCVFMS